MIAIYPFVGTGSVGVNLTGSHKWNLKEPSLVTYPLGFTGSWNGSVSGSTPSGSGTAINTTVTPSTYYPNYSTSSAHISILSYDTPVSSSILAGTGMTKELAVSTLAGDYGTPAAAYSVRKVRTAYSGALMDVRRDYDNTTGSVGYVLNGDLDTGSLLDFVVAGRAVLPGAYSGLAAAYSLRKVSGSYTGSAIDVRRSYDNTTGSVGFDSNGNLNTASLNTFVSRGDNFVLYSQDFDNGYWTKYDSVVTPNTFIAPDGTLTADTVVFNLGNRELIKYSPTVPPTSSFSMFVSGTAGETIGIGSVVYSGGTVTQTYTLGTGWMRISASFSGSSDGIRLISSGTARTVYAWGAQLNSGSIPLPYVRTTTATKTNESGSFDTVSTGWVAQWYDQSGNARHATQTATGSQPLIVSSGSLVTENGRPVIQFNPKTYVITGLNTDNMPLPHSFVMPVRLNNLSSNGFNNSSFYVGGDDSNNLGKYELAQTNLSIVSQYRVNSGLSSSAYSPTNTSSMYLHTGIFTTSSVTTFINSQTSESIGPLAQDNYANNKLFIGGYSNTTNNFTFKTGEFLVYSSSLSGSRIFIENNINTYYNVYTSSNAGYVARWYDQSGNNRHATQTATGSQPLIVLSGSIILDNTKPALDFDGVNDFYNFPNLTPTSNDSIFLLGRRKTNSSNGIFLSNTGSSFPYRVGHFNNDEYQYQAAGYKLYGLSNTANQDLISAFANGYGSTGFLLYVNSIQPTLLEYGTSGYQTPWNSIGSSNAFSNAYAQEILVYSSNQINNREPIEYGINNYYNIYPQTSSFATSSFAIYATTSSISASINNDLQSGIASSGPLGFITVSRTGSNSLTLARNGVTSSFAVPASGALSTNLYLGAINNNGLTLGSSPYNISFASVGTGLTGADLANLNRLTYNLQSNLGRIDPNASSFLTAASITDVTQSLAINTLVFDLKAYGIWDKMKAIYPFVGGTPDSHKFNLKDISLYTIIWSGSVTHNSNGITGNGTNAYGDTGLNENSVLTLNNSHISIYQRNILSTPSNVSMGAGASGFSRFYLNFGGSNYSTLQGTSQAISTVVTPQRGMFIMSRTNSSQFIRKQNDLPVETLTNSAGSKNNSTFILLANNQPAAPNEWSLANLAFSSIGDGLTDTEATNLYTAVQRFQTTLGRQV
jgi:hypothetical protein